MRKTDKLKKKISVLMVFFLITISLTSCKEKSYLEKKAANNEKTQAASGRDDEDSEKGSKKDAGNDRASDDNSLWFVDVSGAVNSPGVYRLKPDSRVFDVIKCAGGLRADADVGNINQAALIKDGQKIIVKSVSDSESEAADASSGGDTGLIALNRASKEELMTLPGIGESKAGDIIDYREKHRGFSSLEELMDIPGIKEGVYNKLSDKIILD